MKLVVEKIAIFSVHHAIHVLDDERPRHDRSESPVKLPIEKIDWCVYSSAPALAVSSAGITAHQQLSSGEPFEVRDITFADLGVRNVIAVGPTGEC